MYNYRVYVSEVPKLPEVMAIDPDERVDMALDQGNLRRPGTPPAVFVPAIVPGAPVRPVAAVRPVAIRPIPLGGADVARELFPQPNNPFQPPAGFQGVPVLVQVPAVPLPPAAHDWDNMDVG